MLKTVSDGLWDEIGEIARDASYRYAAVAYVTSDKYIKFGEGDILIVDASNEAIKTGKTSAKILEAAHTRGAELYSVDELHAKVFALGRVAVVGSSNISSASAKSLIEAAIITDHPSAIAGALAFINELQEQAIPIDDDFIERILKLPVNKPTPRPSKKRKVVIPEHRTWLVSVTPIDEEKYPDEIELAEEGEEEAAEHLHAKDSTVSWLRFVGSSLFKREAKPGDSIIQIWWNTPKSKQAKVQYPCPILRRQDETPTRTRFYLEDFVDEDKLMLSWTKFAELWSKATDEELPKKSAVRLLKKPTADLLATLWKVDFSR
jgi:hypothetical protein